MKKFEIIMTRDITESRRVTVFAENADAVNDMFDLEDLEPETAWETDDNSCGRRDAYITDVEEILNGIYVSGCGCLEIQIPLTLAATGSHSGSCDLDVLALSRLPEIKLQLDNINPETLRDVLDEYGAWGNEELADHKLNLQRILWIACGDIVDNEVYQADES